MFGGALAGLLRWVDKDDNRLTAFIENGERIGVVHAGNIHRRHVADFNFAICQPPLFANLLEASKPAIIGAS